MFAEEKDLDKAAENAAEETPAKKAPAKKPAAKKPAAKKPAAKKDDAEKTEAKSDDKKATAKKPAAKKDDAEKTEAKSDDKKATAKKPAAKKAPAKKEAPSEPTFVRATARYVRSSPRKSRLVVDHIRDSSVEDARVFLQFTARHVGRDVAKVLESAVANAEHNHELDADNLHIVKAFVDEGPTLKRWRPRAKGRATQILKRTSHITVVVSDVPSKELKKNRKVVA
jgi:ribosomal protein L22